MENYKIEKILSNNVVLVNKNNQHFILVGKGIGFGKKKGNYIENQEIIEERFISLKNLNEDDYNNFLDTIDPNIIELSNKIFEMIENELDEKLNPNVLVGFIDHINFTIKRIKEGIDIINPFLMETKILYPLEFNIAEKAVKILSSNLKIEIPEAEVGFLTLHIYGGRGNRSKRQALEKSMMINKILELVETKLDIKIERDSFISRRFILHLLGLIDRISNNNLSNNIFNDLIKELKYEFTIAKEVAKIIEETIKLKITDDELCFLVLHIHRLRIYYSK